MATGQKLYPRATVKKIVKAHSKCNVSKNVDVMVRFPTRLPNTLLTAYEDLPRLRPLSTNVCIPSCTAMLRIEAFCSWDGQYIETAV